MRQASTTVPVVFTTADDPVADGFVASMARPGGNLTGLAVTAGQEEARRLQLLRDLAPGMTRVALLWTGLQVGRIRQVEAAAPVLGLQILSLKLDRPDDLDATLASAIAWHADGLHMTGASGFLAPLVPRIVEVAAQNRWPTVSATPSVARVGGLLAYGPNIPDLYRRAAGYVDKILNGANPGELPIERPAKFEFVVNLKTARAIGLTVPQSILEQATEVIQ
ncbi:MAG: ABC transporter substrate-binding protein [Chloroflexota bacterium]